MKNIWNTYSNMMDVLGSSLITLETLSKDDYGSENVGKTMNLRSFKLNHVYLGSLNMSKFVVVCPRPP